MHSAICTRLGLGLAASAFAALLSLALVDRDGPSPRTARASGPEAKQSGGELGADNTLCYVCHLDLKTEEITTSHLAEDVGCTKCHGKSAEHMHDEMLMTKPDQLFGRLEVEGMCGKCHEDPHEDKAAEVEAFLHQWRGRERPNGRMINEVSICTDCHGTHNIVTEMGSKTEKKPAAEWLPAFNGESLAGWKPSGEASWKVKLGRITGTPGPGARGGDLWTETEYDNYLLAVTFRAERPTQAAIWLRGNDSQPGPRIEIVECQKPLAFTGSVYLPGKGLALTNLRDDLFDPEGWNTLSAKVEGDRVQVWLNGEEIGAVLTGGAGQGRIGLRIEGGSETAELAVREVLVQKLPEEESGE